MKVLELVQAAQKSRAKAFGSINEKRSVAIVKAVLAELNNTIENTEQGRIALPGLGVFVANKIKLKKEGAEGFKRRIVFKQRKVAKKVKKVKTADSTAE